LELDATGLIDRERLALDSVTGATQPRGPHKVVSGIGEAMRRRRDLGLNQRGARRVVDPGEFGGERIQAIECVRIAEGLDYHALEVDHRFGDAGELRVTLESCPFTAARALQVDRGDLPVGREPTGK